MGNYSAAFRRGVIIGIGPSLYYKENFLRTEDGRGMYAVDSVFKKYIKEESPASRCELLEECKLTVFCCPIEAATDLCACTVDCCTAPFFGCNCSPASLSRKKGCYYVGAGTGNCLKIGSDALLCIMSCAYLSTRCCCFEATDCVKCKIVPFPVVEPFFWHADISACCNGKEMPSDVALDAMLEKARREEQMQRQRTTERHITSGPSEYQGSPEGDVIRVQPRSEASGEDNEGSTDGVFFLQTDHQGVTPKMLVNSTSRRNSQEELEAELLAIRDHQADTQSMQGLPGSRSNSSVSNVQRLSPVFINLGEGKPGSPGATSTISDHHRPEKDKPVVSEV